MKTPQKLPVQPLPKPEEQPADLPWQEIVQAVQGVRFGIVQLVIQDGRVIQIDKTEKIRLV